MAVAKFKSKLNSNHKLFEKLENDAPDWWKNLVNLHHNRKVKVYIDIRKNNTINVYYLGASIAKIEWKDSKIQATCHRKYIEGKDIKGKDTNESKYINCEEFLTREEKIRLLFDNAKKCYAEASKEKLIQGTNYCENTGGLYIDSEFAHRYEEKKRNTIRIDLVRVVNNKIQFVELKHSQDRRWKIDNKVKDQIDQYRNFLSENKGDILDYYKLLLEIKTKLGIIKRIDPINVEDLGLDTEPYLEVYIWVGEDNKIKSIAEQLDGVQYQIIRNIKKL